MDRLTSYIFGFALIGLLHPLHLSITNIEIQKNKQSISLVSKVFVNDFHSAISLKKNANNGEINQKDNKNEKLNEYNYIIDNLKLKFNNKYISTSQWKFKKRTNDDQTFTFEFIITSGEKITGDLILENTLLTEIFPDQKNLVMVTSEGTTNGFEFSSKKISQIILK